MSSFEDLLQQIPEPPHAPISHLPLLSQATFDAVRTLVIRLQYLPHALIPTLACNNELVSQPLNNVYFLAPTGWGDCSKKMINGKKDRFGEVDVHI